MSALPPHPDDPTSASGEATDAPVASAAPPTPATTGAGSAAPSGPASADAEPAATGRGANGIAVAALALGAVAIATGIWTVIPVLGIIAGLVAFLPALLAVVFGAVGRHRAAHVGIGRGPATAGLWLGAATLAIIVLTALAWVLIAGASAAMDRY
ncbi:hypothetical protein [Agromyces sp. SYSU T00194]|uniref:hypothetical protein n=1 Tax=Agromyces chitinivorans TaxID=3158560 RepID=UPI00339856C9